MSSYDPFAPDYDVWAETMTEDVGWYVSLAAEAEEPIVELAVGTGRVAVPIATETGKRVIGIDASPAMLAVARERSAGLPVELQQGDMRDLVLDEPVQLIICPFRSMLHLPTWADRRRVFERVASSLQPGGRFAWNVFAFSAQLAAALDGKRTERPGGNWEIVRNVPADSRIDITRGKGVERFGTLAVVGDQEGMGGSDRRVRARARGALRRVPSRAVRRRLARAGVGGAEAALTSGHANGS